MTAPQHAASRRWYTEVLDWLLGVAASLVSRFAPETPAPHGGPAQEPRPGDPPAHTGAVRAGATIPRGCPLCIHLDHPYGCVCGSWPDNPPSMTPAPVLPRPVQDAPAAPTAGAPSPVPVLPPGGTGDHLWPGGPATAPAGSRRSNEQQSARAPQRGTWVISQPPPGSPLGWTPVLAVRRDGVITVSPNGHVEVQAAASTPALRTLTAPNPVLDDDTRPLRRLPVRPVGSPPWDAAPRPDGPEPQPREHVTRRGDTEAHEVSWHLLRAYEQLHAPACPDDSAGLGSAVWRARTGAAA